MEQGNVVRIRRLELEQFRIHRDLAINVPPAGLRIIGRNGSGKSTLLEAVELLATTRPRRGSTDADLIAHDSGIDLGVDPYARVVGEVDRGDVGVRLEIFIQRVARKGASKKLIRVADRPRRAGDVVGLVPAVIFAPDDLDLVLGSPSVRRRFLDILLSQIDRRYLRNLSRYAKILVQRNGLLRQAAEAGAYGDQFAYWDEQIVALGSYIVAARAKTTASLGMGARGQFAALSDRSGDLDLAYMPTIHGSDDWWRGVVSGAGTTVDMAQHVAVAYERQLRDGRSADLARGASLIGPHRDDLALTLAGRPLQRYGSRGQQRLAVIALKMAEIETIYQMTELRPVLLLDDVLSELDVDHQATLVETLFGGGSQVWITSTERRLLDRPELSGLAYLELTDAACREPHRS